MIGSEKVDAVWKTVDKQQQFWQKKCQNIMGEGGKKVKWEKIRISAISEICTTFLYNRLQILLHTKKIWIFTQKNGSEIHKFRSLDF